MPNTLEIEILRRKLSAADFRIAKELPPAFMKALYPAFVSSEAMSTEFAFLFKDAVEKIFDDTGVANVKIYLWMDEFQKLQTDSRYYHACVDMGINPYEVSYAIHPIRKSEAFKKLKGNTPEGAKSWMGLSWAYTQIESALGLRRWEAQVAYEDLVLDKLQSSRRLAVAMPYLDLLEGKPFTADHDTRFARLGKI